MKKVTLLSFALMLTVLVFGQRALNHAQPYHGDIQLPNTDVRNVVDTLFPPFIDMPCAANGLFVYTDGDGQGYVFGNNGYGDKEKTQKINLPSSGNGTVSGAIIFWAAKNVGDDGSVTLLAYDVDAATSGPGNLLATGSSLNVSAVDTAAASGGGVNVMTFTSPVSFTNAIHIGIDLTGLSGTDSVSLLGTEDGCGEAVSSWELWSDDTWHDITTAWGFSGPVEMLMAAIVDWTVSGIDDAQVANGGLTLRPATPNPAVAETIINFDLAINSDVEVKVVGIDGKIVKEVALGKLGAGAHQHSLDVTDLAAGNYYYLVSANGNMLASQFTVNR